jgi:uncharacterized membrane protein
MSGLRLAIALTVLIAAISTAHFVLGLTGGVAIIVGVLSGYVITKFILRYVPDVPAASDLNLSHMRLGRKWLIWSIAMLVILHFLAMLGWGIAISLSVVGGVIGMAVDWRVRAQARARLENGT